MLKKQQLGIHFSSNFINILEQQSLKVLNFSKLPCMLQEKKSGLSQTVVDEVKIVSLIKERLLDSNIISRDVVLTLPSNDLIVRFFEIPFVPRGEIASTVSFEVKRYIPFRLEELIYDFQTKHDRKTRKITVLFIAVKKEIINRHISILEQADLNILAIEPSFLSTLRVLKFIKAISAKELVVVVDVDFEAGLGDITVIENLYPRFSRDFNLIMPDETPSHETIITKLINEVRISLDYCRRQFKSETLDIDRIVLLSAIDVAGHAETLNKELELLIVPVNIQDRIDIPGEDFGSGLIKAYGASLKDAVDFPLRIDLLKGVAPAPTEGGFELESIIKKIARGIDRELLVKNILIFCGIVFMGFLLGLREVNMAKNIHIRLKNKRENVAVLESLRTINRSSLRKLKKQYKEKITIVENMKEHRVYITPKFSSIAALRRKGAWMNSLNFKKVGEDLRFILSGFVSLNDEEEEFNVVNQFLADLKKEESFADFKNISLASLSYEVVDGHDITKFEILCE